MDQGDKFQHLFCTKAVQQDLKRSSIRAFAFIMSTQAGMFVLRIGSTAILARLLVPEHFGVFMMVTAITAIADQFRDLGLSTATIQREHINHREVTNLFWINAGAGLVLSVVTCAAAPLVAAYYQDARLTSITMALAITFLLGGLTVQHEALLSRQMKQGQKSLVHLTTFLLSSVLAVALALQGFGYWALVWREIVRSVLVVVGVWWLCPWFPSLPDRRTDVRPLLSFGSGLTATYILCSITSSMDRFLIGRAWGAAPVALYRQSYQLVVTPMSQLMGPLYQVALPGLSMLQGDPARFRNYYCRLASVVAMVSMPLSVFLAIYAEEITHLVLGKQWSGAAIFFRIFALGGILRSVSSTMGFVLVSRGYSGKLLKLAVANALVTITLMCLGLRWGAAGVAIGDAAGVVTMFGIYVACCFRDSPVSISSFFSALVRPLVASLLMGASLLAAHSVTILYAPVVRVSVGCAVGLLVLAASWLLMPGGRMEMRSLLSDSLGALRRKRLVAIGEA